MSSKNPLRQLLPSEQEVKDKPDQASGSGETSKQAAAGSPIDYTGHPPKMGDRISLNKEKQQSAASTTPTPTPSAVPSENISNGPPGNASAGHNTPALLSNSSKHKGGEKLREKAMKKLHGPDANPSMLGDPISMKNETTDNLSREEEERSASHQKSKL